MISVMKFSEYDLEHVSKTFWEYWRSWRLSQGWSLGPTNTDMKMSSALHEEWSQLSDNNRLWFREHAALVLHSVPDPPTEEDMTVLTKKVVQCEKAILSGDMAVALRKARTARKILFGEKIVHKR